MLLATRIFTTVEVLTFSAGCIGVGCGGITYVDVTSFPISCTVDALSSLLSDLNALHENFAMSKEDVNRCLPVRKWGEKVLQPEAGVEVEMTFPNVSQQAFDLLLTYWSSQVRGSLSKFTDRNLVSRPSIYQSFSTSHRVFSLILHQRIDEVEASQTT